MATRSVRAGLLVGASVLLGVGASALGQARAPLDPAALTAQLEGTAIDWNRGDLDAFIAPYDGASTFMTADGPIGRDAMRARYQQKYFGPNGEKPRPLRFERIGVRALGDDHALMTGRYVLGGDGKPDQTGWFSLVWVRTAQGWRILHDHTG